MRRFVIWMMLCLLPLRLWAGDAMAVQHTPAAAHHGPVAALVSEPLAHPCHGADAEPGTAHRAPLAADSGGAADASFTLASVHGHTDASHTQASHIGTDPTGSEHGAGCGDCGVCHGPLAGLTVAAWAAKTLPAALPHTLGWPALSATALPHLKPPRA